MEYRPLGRTDIKVSVIGLGSMTWGQQNTEAEGHAQLDCALAEGVNFIDTAEMYAVPPRAETCGRTEQIIGAWLKKRARRDDVIIATKVVGPSRHLAWVRDGNPRLDRRNIEAAVDASLRRLQTDYVDLYLAHWPERDANFFGRLDYYHAPEKDGVPIEDTVAALGDLVRAGKIRHFGMSNETAWGMCRWIRSAEKLGLPRPAAIQNPYNLLNRSFEIGLSEFAHREGVGLVAYSPLGFGVLSGKYLGDSQPPGARITLFGNRYRRYSRPEGVTATAAYVALARRNGMDPAQMALAFVRTRPFLTSMLVGATTLEQLKSNLDSRKLILSKDLLGEIETIHTRQPNPCP
ncbi:MAG: NADP(H)-dependent aldo-keto reductase [Gammaproteobacteria bacterium]|nr:NADP(H)-dependent aldo-keto reductase [Gammaproteobacteria bacterium]